MSRSFRAFTFAAVVLCAIGFTHAEIRDRGFEVSGFGGIQSGDNNEKVSSAEIFGLRLAYAISPRIMIEASISSFETERGITGFAGSANEPANQVRFDEIASTDFTYYGFGLTANFRTDLDVRIIPYLSVGLGVVIEERAGANFCVDLKDSDSTDCSNFRADGTPIIKPNLPSPDLSGVEFQIFVPAQDTGSLISPSGGVRIFLTPTLAARVDFRYYHHDSFNVNQDAFEASVGLSYIFGGRR